MAFYGLFQGNTMSEFFQKCVNHMQKESIHLKIYNYMYDFIDDLSSTFSLVGMAFYGLIQGNTMIELFVKVANHTQKESIHLIEIEKYSRLEEVLLLRKSNGFFYKEHIPALRNKILDKHKNSDTEKCKWLQLIEKYSDNVICE